MPIVGEYYLVHGPNNIKVPANIVDLRKVIDNDGNEVEEYYMHYKNLDHRLDNWVNLAQIDVDSGALISFDNIDVVNMTDERLTRLQKRKKCGEEIQVMESFDHQGPEVNKNAQFIKPQIKSISCIQFGSLEIECWYVSKYPEDILTNTINGNNSDALADSNNINIFGSEIITKLWICQYCLRYMKYQQNYLAHKKECQKRQPPGVEVYRKGPISVYEVDGKINTLYCQNLCLMSKLFLDHKAVYFDVDPFLFYILTYVNKNGAHLLGYFSKEKVSLEGNNLACILVLPPFQKFGFGNFLISLSYELSKIEGAVGRPEKPLSDLGQASYRKYWCTVLLKNIKLHGQNISIRDLSKLTSITQEDILNTLKAMNMTKYWKCKHVICCSNKQLDEALLKITTTSSTSHFLEIMPHDLTNSSTDCVINSPKYKCEFDPTRLSWKPTISIATISHTTTH